MDKYDSKIYGINCNVANCVHNRSGCECVADKIDINHQCSTPHASEETQCNTFTASQE